jgi:hypothetical protein
MAGASEKEPPRSVSRIFAKTERLSNLGQQSQSIEPSLEISAAECVSPMIA